MTAVPYEPGSTAELLVGPYYDFLSENGKLWPMVGQVAAATGTVANMRAVVAAAREAKMKIFFVPHHRWASGDFDGWRFPTPSQQGAGRYQVFGKDTWGGSFHQDFPVCDRGVVVAERWAQSGFSGTDLDQQLRQHGTDHVIVIGMMANTCVESTARYPMELGYHVTLVTDATAAASADAMRAAHAVNGPTYAHEITDTRSLLADLAVPG